MKRLALFSIPLVGLIPTPALAHCPLCVAGAGALAVAAAYFGVSSVVVGVLIGAFALALGLWIAPLAKKTFVPYQKQLIVAAIYLSTIIPIMPLIRDHGPLYVSLWGPYGTLLNKTYVVDLFLAGALLGAAVVVLVPYVSSALTKARGSTLPFQGTGLTLMLLIGLSIAIQVWPR